MLIRVYQCWYCGSVLLEDNNAERSDDREVHCPFCSNGAYDMQEIGAVNSDPGQYKNFLGHTMSLLNWLGLRFNE